MLIILLLLRILGESWSLDDWEELGGKNSGTCGIGWVI